MEILKYIIKRIQRIVKQLIEEYSKIKVNTFKKGVMSNEWSKLQLWVGHVLNGVAIYKY